MVILNTDSFLESINYNIQKLTSFYIINLQLMMFGIYRNYNKDIKFLSVIQFSYQLLINSNITLAYCMVRFLNVKIRSIPIERGFYLISVVAAIYYILFTMLLFITVSWRLKSIDDALVKTEQISKKKIVKRLKTILKMWCKIEEYRFRNIF